MELLRELECFLIELVKWAEVNSCEQLRQYMVGVEKHVVVCIIK